MIRRFYNTTCVLYSTKKQGLKLCKMLNPKSKRQWFPSQSIDMNMLPTLKSLTKTTKEPDNRGVRRMAVLNKLFMKHVTDIMSTGTVSMDIVGRGIEISKVQVTPDFKTVNVFWVCKGNSTDEETERVLKNTAGPLRHELSTLRLMGDVPYICFVKDKQEALIVDLDRRLAIADYGEDYIPTDIGQILKSEFTLDLKLSNELKAKIKNIEDEQEIVDDPIPDMTNSIYGLDHSKIMNRLLATRKRTSDAWASLDSDSPVISYRKCDESSSNIDVKKQKQELAEFLLKRQILQNKLHKKLRERDVTTPINDQYDAEERLEDIKEYCDDYRDDYDIEVYGNTNSLERNVADDKV
ncbi:uncharacterized protein LOC119831760 [Zerene cesonia]|uniref:uncharacterized protein LOC119831760 n=1 Tax=Zerene cesonia TaxID=33412 RepID=UPI0018E55BCD|nr:uncharacterized protein LOC119831760 [Zerene cesonia]